MNRLVKSILLPAMALLVALPCVSMAQEPALTMNEAVQRALRDNPGIKAMASSLKAGQEDVYVSRSHLMPKFRFETRYMKTDNPTYAFSSKLNQARFTASDFDITALNSPEEIADYQTSISFEQALFARQAWVGLGMARTQAESLKLELGREREKVMLDVTKAYLNVLTAKEYLNAAEHGVQDATEHLRIAHAHSKAGLGLSSDTLRTDVSHKEASERLIKAQKGLMLAKRMLGLLLGADGPVDVTSNDPGLSPLSLQEYLDASVSRLDVRAMGKKVENASNNVSLATAGYYPVLGVGGSYQINSHSKPFEEEGSSYQVMAFLRWDIYDGGVRSHSRAKARHGLNQARQYLNGLRKEVSFRVHEAYLNLEEAAQSLELSDARVALALESARLITKRYENSLSTVVELLDAQTALNVARAEVVAKKNKYRIAVAELKYQSGLLHAEFETQE